MDYEEEQDGEMEALEAIYSEELTVVSRERPYCVDVLVKGSNEESVRGDEEALCLSCVVRFTMVEMYPDEVPLMEIDVEQIEGDDFSEDRVEKLLEHLNEVAAENVGMVMVFTLVSAAQEMLLQFVDDIRAGVEEQKQAEYLEQKRLEELKYKGTPVTLENFLAWKIRFDEEMKAAGKQVIKDALMSTKSSAKLTGKQMFERDSSMNVSDMQFLTNETTTTDSGGVKVDESLFQDLDDLDLDDLDDLEDEEE